MEDTYLIDDNRGGIVKKLIHHLTACTTRHERRWTRGITVRARQCQCREVLMAERASSKHRRTLSAVREAVAAVLDIATGNDFT